MSIAGEDIAGIAIRSIVISGSATLLASLWSIPISYIIAIRGVRKIIEAVIEAMVGMPTVLLGLLLYYLFTSSGPLGFLGLLYTPIAIIIGEAILITPLLIAVIYRASRDIIVSRLELAISLGASRIQPISMLARETSSGVIAAIIMGFSRALGELGIALMVGGNIKDYTRVMTTAIALDIIRGDFEKAIALGLILLLIIVSIMIAIKRLSDIKTIWGSY
jgi:tungstate transport system permease protein